MPQLESTSAVLDFSINGVKNVLRELASVEDKLENTTRLVRNMDKLQIKNPVNVERVFGGVEKKLNDIQKQAEHLLDRLSFDKLHKELGAAADAADFSAAIRKTDAEFSKQIAKVNDLLAVVSKLKSEMSHLQSRDVALRLVDTNYLLKDRDALNKALRGMALDANKTANEVSGALSGMMDSLPASYKQSFQTISSGMKTMANTVRENVGKSGALLESLADNLQHVDTAADGALSAIKVFNQQVGTMNIGGMGNDAARTADEITTAKNSLLSFADVAGAVKGNIASLFTASPKQLLSAIRDVSETIGNLSTNTDVFSKIFSPEAAQQAERMKQAMDKVAAAKKRLDAAIEAGAGEDTPPDAGQDGTTYIGGSQKALDAIKEFRRSVHAAQEENVKLSNTLLATMTATEKATDAWGGKLAGSANALLNIATITGDLKRNIQSYLSMTGEGSNVLDNMKKLQQDIVNIVKMGGEAESDIIADKLRELNISSRAMEYSNTMLANAREMSSLPVNKFTTAAQKALLNEARTGFQISALAAQSPSDFDAAQKGYSEASVGLENIQAEEQVRSSLLNVATAIQTGLKPAYGELIAAMEKYAAVSTEDFGKNQVILKATAQTVDMLKEKYAQLSSVGTSGSIKDRQASLDAMRQLTVLTGTQTAGMEKYLQKEQAILNAEREREAVNKRIQSDMDKLTALIGAGVNVIGNRNKLEQAYVEAIRNEVPVEQAIYSQLKNKLNVLRDVWRTQQNVKKTIDESVLSAKEELNYYKMQRDQLTFVAQALEKRGRGIDVDGKSVTTTKAKEELELVNQRVVALTQAVVQEEAYAKSAQFAEQVARNEESARQSILNTLKLAVQQVQQGALGEREYMAAVRASIDAQVAGVNVNRARLNLQEAHNATLAKTLSEEQALRGIMQNGALSLEQRAAAAERWLKVEQSAKRLTAGGVTKATQNDKTFVMPSADNLVESEKLANSLMEAFTGKVGAASAKAKDLQTPFMRLQTSISEAVQGLQKGENVLANLRTVQNGIVQLSREGHTAEAQVHAERLREAQTLEAMQGSYRSLVQLSDTLRNGEAVVNSTIGTRVGLLREALEIARQTATATGERAGKDGTQAYESSLEDVKAISRNLQQLEGQEKIFNLMGEAVSKFASGAAPDVDKIVCSLRSYVDSVRVAGETKPSADAIVSFRNVVLRNVEDMEKKMSAMPGLVSTAFLKNLREAIRLANELNIIANGQNVLDRRDTGQLEARIAQSEAMDRLRAAADAYVAKLDSGADITRELESLTRSWVDAVSLGIPVSERIAQIIGDESARTKAMIQQVLNLNTALRAGGLSVSQQNTALRTMKTLLEQISQNKSALQHGVDVGGRMFGASDISRMQVNTNTQFARQQAPDTSAKAYIDTYLKQLREGKDLAFDTVQYEQEQRDNVSALLSELERVQNISNDLTQSNYARAQALDREAAIWKQIVGLTNAVGVNVNGKNISTSDAVTAMADVGIRRKNLQGEMTPAQDKGNAGFLSIRQAIADTESALADQQRLMLNRNELETSYAQRIQKTRTEMLSGINVYENFVKLQNLLNDAAIRGVDVDRESVAILNNKAAVAERVANSVRKTLDYAMNPDVPGASASVAVQRTRPDMAFLRELGVPMDELDAKLDAVIKKAGKDLPGSLAAAAAKLEESVNKAHELSTGMGSASTQSARLSEANENTVIHIRALIPAFSDVAKAQRNLINNQEFLTTAASKTINEEYKYSAVLDKIVANMEKAMRLQDRASTSFAQIGVNNLSDFADNPRAAASTANRVSRQQKDPKSFIQGAGAVSELNAVLQETIRLYNALPPAQQKAFSGQIPDIEAMARATDQANSALNKYLDGQKKLGANSAGASFFDTMRIKWFAMLRMFWSMYNSIFDLINQTAEYNHTLNVLQAVTQGTERDVSRLAAEFTNLSTTVPIALSEVANAALEVAKAGYGVEDTMKIVKASSRLAVAAQSDIKTVSDLQSVILHAWQGTADQAEVISDQLFNAVAKSRADIEGLADAIGYVAGIAPQANVSLDSSLAIISILTNAGLTMSKAGTYTRQFLNDLMNPSEKLKGIIASLGLTAADIDPRLNDIASIFELLGDRGMNVADAFEGMSIRAASAFSVMLRNRRLIQSYTDDINQLGVVNDAFAVAADDVKTAWTEFQNSIMNVSVEIGNLLGGPAKELLNTVTGWINGFRELVFQIKDGSNAFVAFQRGVMSLLTIGTLALSLRSIVGLFGKLFGFSKSMGVMGKDFVVVASSAKKAQEAIKGITTATTGVGAAMTGLGALAGKFGSFGVIGRFLLGPQGALIITLIGTVMSALSALWDTERKSLQEYNDALDDLKQQIEDFKSTAAKEIDVTVRYGEARHIQASAAASGNELRQMNMETPSERNYARMLMQQTAALFRSSSNTDEQKFGNELAKMIFSTGSSAETAAESLAKFLAKLDEAPSITGKAQQGVEDWGKSMTDEARKLSTSIANTSRIVSGMVKQSSAIAGRSGEDVAKEVMAMPTFGMMLNQRGMQNLLQHNFGNAQDKVLESLSDLHRNYLAELPKGMGEMSMMDKMISTSLFAPNAIRSDSKFNPSQAVRTTNSLSKDLEEMGMALTSAEHSMLLNADSTIKLRAAIESIISSRLENTRSNTGLTKLASPEDAQRLQQDMQKQMSGLITLMSTPAPTDEAAQEVENAYGTVAKLMGELKNLGLADSSMFKGLFGTFDTLTKKMEDFREATKAAKATLQDMINADMSNMTPEDMQQRSKQVAEGVRGEFQTAQQITSRVVQGDSILAMSSNAQAQMRNVRYDQTQKAIEQIFKAFGSYNEALSRGVDATELMTAEFTKSANKAFADLAKVIGNDIKWNSPDVISQIDTVKARLEAENQKQGANQNIDEFMKLIKPGKNLLASWREMARNNAMDTMTDIYDAMETMYSQIGEATAKGYVGKELDAALELIFYKQKRINRMMSDLDKTVKKVNNSSRAFNTVQSNARLLFATMDSLSSTNLDIMESAEAWTEVEEATKNAGDAMDDADVTIKTVSRSLEMLKNQVPFTSMELDAVETAGKALADNITTARQEMEKLRKAAKSNARELNNMKYDSGKDQLEYRQRVAKLDRYHNYNNYTSTDDQGGNQFYTDIELSEAYDRNNFDLLSTDKKLDVAKQWRDKFLELAEQAPRGGEHANVLYARSLRYNEVVEQLEQLQQQQKELQIQAELEAMQNIASNTADAVNYLRSIESYLNNAKSAVADRESTYALPGRIEPKAGYSGNAAKGLYGLAARYESGKAGSRAVGWDAAGGTSYGTYQFSSAKGTFAKFLNFMKEFDPELFRKWEENLQSAIVNGKDNPGGYNVGSNDMRYAPVYAWSRTAGNMPDRMLAAEQAFMKSTHFDPAMNNLVAKTGKTDWSEAVQQAIFSGSTQHGGINTIVNNALASLGVKKGDAIDEEAFVRAFYNARTKYVEAIPEDKMDAKTRKSIITNRYPSELADVLAAMKQEQLAHTPSSIPQTQVVAAQTDGAKAANPQLASPVNAEITTSSVKIETPEADVPEAVTAEVKRQADETVAVSEQVKQAAQQASEAQAQATELVDTVLPETVKLVTQAAANLESALSRLVNKILELLASLPRKDNGDDTGAGGGTGQSSRLSEYTGEAAASTGDARGMAAVANDTAKSTQTMGRNITVTGAQAADSARQLGQMAASAGSAANTLNAVNNRLANIQLPSTSLTGDMTNAEINSPQTTTSWLQGHLKTKSQEMYRNQYGSLPGESNTTWYEQYMHKFVQTQTDTIINSIGNAARTGLMAAFTGEEFDFEEVLFNLGMELVMNWVQQNLQQIGAGMLGGLAGIGSKKGFLGGFFSGFMGRHEGGLVERHTGGLIPGYSSGGKVRDGNIFADSTLAALTKGEYVMQEPAVRAFGTNFMDAVNNGNLGSMRDKLYAGAKTADDQARAGGAAMMSWFSDYMNGGNMAAEYARQQSGQKSSAAQEAFRAVFKGQQYNPETFTSMDKSSTVAAGAATSGGNQRSNGGRGISIVNFTDPADFNRYLATSRGARTITNFMNQQQRKQSGEI
jgi:hypothetical protein